jgi:putative hemolysin
MSWVLVLVCLALSFVFSGVEAGLLSLNRVRLRHLARQGDPAAARLQRILHGPTQVFVTVLVVTSLMNISAIVITANHLVDRFGPWGYALTLALALPFFLLVIEFCAKSIFRRLGYRVLAAMAVPLEVVSMLLLPFVVLSRPVAKLILRHRPAREIFVAREDLKYIATQSERLGTLTSFERQMIHNVVDFRTVKVTDVMVPLAQTKCVNVDATVEEVVNLSRHSKTERFPVLSRDGQIVGLVNTIDLVVDRASNHPVSFYTRRIVQVRSDEPVSRAMRRLRATPQHFALVVNEQGSPVGVVGLSNLLNPLVRVSGTETPSPQSRTLRA